MRRARSGYCLGPEICRRGARRTAQYPGVGWISLTAITLLLLAIGLFVEKLVGREVCEPSEWQSATKAAWAVLIASLVLLSVDHVTVMLKQRADPIHLYLCAGAFAVALIALASSASPAFFCLTGLVLLALNSCLLLFSVAVAGFYLPGLFVWTLIGAALAVVLERCFGAWAESVRSHTPSCRSCVRPSCRSF